MDGNLLQHAAARIGPLGNKTYMTASSEHGFGRGKKGYIMKSAGKGIKGLQRSIDVPSLPEGEFAV
jgi:hypothetical protein